MMRFVNTEKQKLKLKNSVTEQVCTIPSCANITLV